MMAEWTNADLACVERVTKTFFWNGHQCTPVRNVSFRAKRGQLSLLLGRSGSGKTTMLTILAGLVKPTAGTVRLFGKDIEDYTSRERQILRAKRLGFVFQTFHLIGSLTALDNVALVLRFSGERRRRATARAEEVLDRLGIADLALKLPKNLSQGEKQRVAVARAVANDADLILADEPTASLEANQGLEIIELLHNYAKRTNRCVVVATHDRRLDRFADAILHFEDGDLRAV